MNYIKVWCEYDISGNFGGGNNEEVFIVPYNVAVEDVEQLVLDYLVGQTGIDEEELDGLYGLQFITVQTLGEGL